jgi:hypothetical protein
MLENTHPRERRFEETKIDFAVTEKNHIIPFTTGREYDL